MTHNAIKQTNLTILAKDISHFKHNIKEVFMLAVHEWDRFPSNVGGFTKKISCSFRKKRICDNALLDNLWKLRSLGLSILILEVFKNNLANLLEIFPRVAISLWNKFRSWNNFQIVMYLFTADSNVF